MANKTILDKLNELQDAKEDIQAAIREKGGVVSDDTLAGLADDIRDIPQDGYAWGSIGWSEAPNEWQQMVNDARAYKEAGIWIAQITETGIVVTRYERESF